MLKPSSLLTLILALIIILGCGSSGRKKSNTMTYRRNVGKAFPLDMKEKTERILNKFNYTVVRREETYEQIYYETDWRYRSPFEDESELNIADARTSLTVNAVPRTRGGMPGANLYNVHLSAENEVRFEGSEEWVRVPMSNMLIAYLDKIAEDLKLELLQGIRKF